MPKEIKIVCPQCQAKLAVPLPKTQNQSTPFTTRIRIGWFLTGLAMCGIMAVYLAATGGFDAVIFLLILPGVFIPLFIAQWKARTLDAARHKLMEWVGYLAWLGLASMLAFQFSVPLIFLVLGLTLIGAPFVFLNVGMWVLNRIKRKPTKILQVQPQQ